MNSSEKSIKFLKYSSISLILIGTSGFITLGIGLLYYFVTNDKNILSFLN